MSNKVDAIVLGAGIYGLYSALCLTDKGMDVLLVEHDSSAVSRATYVNQARVHMGYHYPRSLSTAKKSAHYFNRFVEDYGFCILSDFDQVYATSAASSWTNGEQFVRFCEAADIPCEELPSGRWFNKGVVDGVFLTKEYTYDAMILKSHFLRKLSTASCRIMYDAKLVSAKAEGDAWRVGINDDEYSSPLVVNATYASANQVNALFGFEAFDIKYELCEIILCDVDDALKHVGLTVMDGPFFSLMPFGKTGYHSLTSVTFTPHETCHDKLPVFACQQGVDTCSREQLGNCNSCPNRPDSSWPYMSAIARKYVKPDLGFRYSKSLYSMKPIPHASEVDDSRPTIVRVHQESPRYISVLSGKINTVYDLESVL